MDKPFTLWLMGPTSSGKTTIAAALHARLKREGLSCFHFDGDEVRDFFGSEIGRASCRERVLRLV